MKIKILSLSLLALLLANPSFANTNTPAQQKFRFESRQLALYLKKDTLDLTYSYITMEDMKKILAYLSMHPEIKTIEMSDAHVDIDSLILLSNNKTLVNVYLPKTVDDRVVIAFATKSKLKELSVGGYGVTDKGAIALAKNTSIEKLYLGGTAIGDEGLAAFGGNNTLKYFMIWGNKFRFSNESFEKFSNNKSIDFLYLSDLHINDEQAISLSHMSSLKYLYLFDNEISDKGAEALSHLPNLIKLSLSGNKITDQGVIALSKYSHASYLDLSNNPITDNGLAALGSDVWLKSIFLDGINFTDQGLIALAKNSNLAKLHIINQSSESSAITDVGIVAIARNHNLTSIGLERLNIGTKSILELAKNPKLQHLHMYGLKGQISSEAVAQLLELPELRVVYLSGILLDNHAARAVSKHQVLDFLACYECEISDPNAVVLAKNKSITWLNIEGKSDHSSNKIGVNGAIALSQNPKIKRLEIDYNNIGDAGAVALAKDRNLKFLSVEYNGLTQYGIDVLLQSGIRVNVDRQ